MIRLIAFFPLEGAAFYEEGGKTFHTIPPYTRSVTEEVNEAEEFAQTTMGYLDGQDRTFENFGALKKFLGDFQIQEIRLNPALKRNRQLLEDAETRTKSRERDERIAFHQKLREAINMAMSLSPSTSISKVELSLIRLENAIEADNISKKELLSLVESLFRSIGKSVALAYAEEYASEKVSSSR